MIELSKIKYGDQITVTLARENGSTATLSGLVEEAQPEDLSIAGWRLTDERLTITDWKAQWLEPADWQTWDGLSFEGKRYIRVVLAKVSTPLGKVAAGLPTVWRAVDEDLTLTDSQLLAQMKDKRVIRLVLSEVWS